jgi:hypothetical protein
MRALLDRLKPKRPPDFIASSVYLLRGYRVVCRTNWTHWYRVSVARGVRR